MSRLAPLAVGLALGLGIAVAVDAFRDPEPPSERPRNSIQDVLDRHATELALDRATLDRAWALANGAREELGAHRAAIAADKKLLATILDAERVDRSRMAATVASISQHESQLRVRELEVMLEIRALLTPSQIEALKRLKPTPRRSSPPPRP